VAVVVVLLVGRGGDGAAAPPARVVPVTVPGTRAWVDTGVDVAAGDRVQITASGTIRHNYDASSTVGPDGDVNPKAAVNNAVVDGTRVEGRHAALIARVGTQPPFVVGSEHTFTAPIPGRLELGVNDVGPDNNSGQFDVTVQVGG
jgi:hypothetical protein